MTQAMELKSFDTLEERVASLERDGFAYFPGYLTDAEVQVLRQAMDDTAAMAEHFDRDTRAGENGAVFREKVINNAFNRNALFFSYLDRPGIIELEEAVHGDDCHVIGMTGWVTGPGRPTQTLHVDWMPVEVPEYVLQDPNVRMPVFITTCHFYLNDIYPELGPTQFIPGSHRSGRRPAQGEITWNGRGMQDCIVKAGDAVVFRCEVWHRGTPNTSDETRYLLQVHYAQRMITQKFPPYLNRFQFDQELLDQASPRQRRLLGDHVKSNYD
ncbi:MAG: phytanoyl-CoA dioxygenase family protein [Caldilineaceae bacterium]|nr:phytanoyl-CoA dioxygenase family protein [Caldilineaceae bacterium]